jgi:hypothetical protein
MDLSEDINMMSVKYSKTRILIMGEIKCRILQKQAEMSRLFNVYGNAETSRDVPPFQCIWQCRNNQRCPAFSMFMAMQKQAEMSHLFNVYGNAETNRDVPHFQCLGKIEF